MDSGNSCLTVTGYAKPSTKTSIPPSRGRQDDPAFRTSCPRRTASTALDADGKIDQAEFQQMFDSVAGVPGEDCATVFAALDRDGSGGLDRAEFHQALTEFFYGSDPDAPANHLFGRVTA
ncbi:EF-hand domain-containing protein [Streptomyces sp. NPDC102365]|uniref:EF-hand domain-containing protein n=1 Tax=Streptomyces sp. NPDC102365 TaxID=3366162 RepID=UPI00380A4BEF